MARDSAARAEHDLVVVEGARVIDGAFDRGADVRVVYCATRRAAERAEAVVARAHSLGVPVRPCAPRVLEHAASTVNPQAVLALARIPATAWGDVGPGLVLVLVGIADPGNLGTILRSAEAAGAAAVVVTDGCVDVGNPKAVRASAGAVFGVPIVAGGSAREAVRTLRERRRIVAAVPSSGTPVWEADFTGPVAVLVGGEAHGLPPDLDVDTPVSIPMAAGDSLNAAMAATVLCFEAVRQNRTSARGPEEPSEPGNARGPRGTTS